MTPIITKVESARAKTELNLHVIHPAITVHLDKKVVIGQIQSFKTEKVIDSFGENGQPQAALVSHFQIDADTVEKTPALKEAFAALNTAVQDFVETNINKLASV